MVPTEMWGYMGQWIIFFEYLNFKNRRIKMKMTLKEAIDYKNNQALLQFDGWVWKEEAKLYIENECRNPEDFTSLIQRLKKVYTGEIKYSRKNIMDALEHKPVEHENDIDKINKHDSFIIYSLLYEQMPLSVFDIGHKIARISYRGPLAEKFYDTYKYLSEMEFFYRVFFKALPFTYLSMRWKGPIIDIYDDDYPYPKKWIDRELNKEFKFIELEDDFTRKESTLEFSTKIGTMNSLEVLKGLVKMNPDFFLNHPEINEGKLNITMSATIILTDEDKKFIESELLSKPERVDVYKKR